MLLNNYSGKTLEAGCDEAGRGCLAGPVVAAAVILPENFYHADLNDSKQVGEANRNTLAQYIKENALHWAIGICSETEIDEINILQASIKAMHKALAQLAVPPIHIIVDGNRFKKFNNIDYTTIVKGDAKYTSIAAASILAKTHRDELMQKLHIQFPDYGWKANKGYPTNAHRIAIAKHGVTPYHRKTFRLLKQQLELF